MFQRLASIDALRGVALLLMVIDHCFDWWLAEAYRGTFADTFTEFLGSLSAPIFVLLVGVGLALSIERGKQRGQTFGPLMANSLRRGGFLIFMGYALNFIIFFVGDNWGDVFAVDVLHLIGLSIIVGTLAAWYLSTIPALILAFVWATASAIYGGEFVLPPAFGAWVNGESGIGYFPVLPWLAYVWLGVGVGKLMLRADGTTRLQSRWLLLVAVGWLALMIFVPNIGFRHPRLGFMCLSMFVAFTVWALLHGLEQIALLRRLIVAPLALMGQVAFMLYFFHHLLGYRLLYHLGIVTGRSWYGQFGALDPMQALIGLLVMIVLCYLVSGPWLRVRKQVEAETLGRVPGFRALRRT